MRSAVRPRTPADLPGCVAALAAVHEASRYPVAWPSDPTRWITTAATRHAWVAEAGGAVAGHAALTATSADLAAAAGLPADELGSVARLFVAPAARGRGLAAALLDVCEAAARADGRRPVLEVESSAAAAIRLYERAGWRRVSTRAASWTAPTGSPAVMHAYLAPCRGAGNCASGHM
ncbi:hypothetical protein BIV57_10390 [Mangrovactinospora gilvigrisea]|uniref:N-acetyltransferase domain-containing protein n=1 Tax=Mangrovactinospora gilvigrisea TaxID=1428644 RepID=A0A1J7BFU6_9ACTN|nr:GNAT family N-acetyltransferase [Mangrovactinospora gilvigrisea]OIV37526.1 hypothetical protein BIV57_10390 [Mangrovactinospora gilvigrisea]